MCLCVFVRAGVCVFVCVCVSTHVPVTEEFDLKHF